MTNVGNDEDTITLSAEQDDADDGDLIGDGTPLPTFYADTNGNGVYNPGVDQPLPASAVTLAAGASQVVFLVGFVPDDIANDGTINVQPVGTSTGDPDYDELEVDGENWAQVNTLTLPDLTLTKTVLPTSGVLPGSTLTYNLTGENTGGSSPFAVDGVATVDGDLLDGILISDAFPADLIYVTGSLEASYTPAGTGEAVLLYSTDGGTTWTDEEEPPSGVDAVGLLIQFPAGTRLAAIDAPTLEYELSFDVTVPDDAAEGDTYANTGVIAFDGNGDGDAGDLGETEETPPVTSTVEQEPGILFGNGDEDEETPPSTTPVNFPATAGTPVNIPLELVNTGNGPDVYDLDTTLDPDWPEGTTIEYFPDVDCDGVPDEDAEAIDETPELAAGDNYCLVAVVTPPVSTTPGTYDVTLTATSQSDPDVTASITNTVTVGLTEGFTFGEDDDQTTTPGSTVTYSHTATNTSNTTVTVDLTATGENPDWTYSYGLDANGDGDLDDPEDIPFGPLEDISGFVLEPGSFANVLVQIVIPDDAESGDTDDLELTATPTYDVAGTPEEGDPVSVTDITTIIAGTIEVTKEVAVNGGTPTQDETEAEPGDTLTYTIVATNTGDAPVTNVIVDDPLPAPTEFESISATTTGFTGPATVLYATSPTGSWATSLTGLAAGATVYVGVSTDGNISISDTDSFPPGATLTITFEVSIP